MKADRLALFPLVAFSLVLCGCDAAPVPSQPIAFSHKIHAGDNKIECLYCHSGARRSSVSSIPSVRMCMGCHRLVAASKPEIARVRAHWEGKIPIRWTRIVKEPDFVYFNHFPHVNRGFLCQECHGPVETMTETRLDHTLNMDRCVSCHRSKGGPIDCFTCHR
ncbi:MAG: cytochrome c3 family protein [Bryobacteraceae bacterium]